MMMTSHLKRWITAMIATPLIFAIIIMGTEAFFASFIIMIVIGAVIEYNKMIFGRVFSWEKLSFLATSGLIALAAISVDVRILLSVVAFSILAVFIIYLANIKNQLSDVNAVGKVILGIMYIPFLLSHLILIRFSENGILWILFIIILAFSGDVAAFYVGRMFGKRKLFPLVSPGKTIEGTIGLIIGSIAACSLFQQFFFPTLSLTHAIILGFIGSILGQLGDLFESAIKRSSGVKDSGSFLAGHGGLLDRLDCIIFITPFVYYYQLFVIK